MADAPEHGPGCMTEVGRECDCVRGLQARIAALEQEREKYRKQLRYWTGQHERIEQTCLRLQDTNARLREALREKATELVTRWSCVCYLPAIHEPCVRCRFIASLRALTEGENDG
jgi:hypothetical protein